MSVIRRHGFIPLAILVVALASRELLAQDVCVPVGPPSATIDGLVASDASWNGAAKIDLDCPGTCPVTYLRLRRTETPEAALYLGLVVNTGGVAPNPGDRIVIGISPLLDSPQSAWRIHVTPFGLSPNPGSSAPASVQYWRNNAPGFNASGGTDPNDTNPNNDWLKPLKMRVFYYGGNRWDFEWKIPLGDIPDKMAQDLMMYLPPAGSTFRFYFNLLKVSDAGFICQYPWPKLRPLTSTLNTGTPDIGFWGMGSLDQRAECSVLLTWDRIGLFAPPCETDHQLQCFSPEGGFPDCSTIQPADLWPGVKGPNNTFYAKPVNRMPTMAKINAEFWNAPWGSPAPGDWTLAQYPDDPNHVIAPLVNPPPTLNLPSFTEGSVTLDWPLTYQQSCMTHSDPFRSIQVRLSSSDINTKFSPPIVERSIDNVSASEFQRTAKIGTKGYQAPVSGPVQMIMTVDKEVKPRPRPGSTPVPATNPAGMAAAAPRPSVSDRHLYRDTEDVAAMRTPSEVEETLTWVCRCFLKTGNKFTIEGQGGNLVLDDTHQGSAFGYICGHRGPVESWSSSFGGAGVTRLADGVFTMDIPHGSSGLVETRIEAEEFRRWGVEFQMGVATPHGVFADTVNSGWTESMALEYRYTPMFAVDAELSVAEFRKGQGGSDVTIVGTSLGTKIYFLEGSIRPFVQAGLGFYVGSPGEDDFGVNVGLGVRVRLSDTVGLEASYRFREVLSAGPDPRYSTLDVGVSLRF